MIRILRFLALAVIAAALLALAPNIYGLCLIGLVPSVAWLWLEIRATRAERAEESAGGKHSLLQALPPAALRRGASLLAAWLAACAVALSLHAWARFISPGFDLAWFAQAVTNVFEGRGLLVTPEGARSHLAQHWEPILYTATPFAALFGGSVGVVLWQALALASGSIAAWKSARFLFGGPNKLAAGALLLFLASWTVMNPLQFDVHPPVVGGVGIAPWIFYCALRGRRWAGLALALLLMQSGEMFLPVGAVWVAYFAAGTAADGKRRFAFPLLGFALGMALLAIYQRYGSGFFAQGQSYPFAHYAPGRGGDAFGILQTALHAPGIFVTELFQPARVKVLLKAFLFLGPLPFLACHSKYRALACACAVASLAWVAKIVAVSNPHVFHTGAHYVAEFGSHWWFLAILGLHAALARWPRLLSEGAFAAALASLALLNLSEWRKSPLVTFRFLLSGERKPVPAELRAVLGKIKPEEGIAFYGTEWLCPLVADRRVEFACEGFRAGGRPLVEFKALRYAVVSKETLFKLQPNFSEMPGDPTHAAMLQLVEQMQYDLPFAENGWSKIGEWEQRRAENRPEAPVKVEVWRYSRGEDAGSGFGGTK